MFQIPFETKQQAAFLCRPYTLLKGWDKAPPTTPTWGQSYTTGAVDTHHTDTTQPNKEEAATNKTHKKQAIETQK